MVKFFQVAKNLDKDVLANIHGVLLVLQHSITDRVDLALIAHDQLLERVLVACLGSLDKLSLIFHVASHCSEMGYQSGALDEPPGCAQASPSSEASSSDASVPEGAALSPSSATSPRSAATWPSSPLPSSSSSSSPSGSRAMLTAVSSGSVTITFTPWVFRP